MAQQMMAHLVSFVTAPGGWIPVEILLCAAFALFVVGCLAWLDRAESAFAQWVFRPLRIRVRKRSSKIVRIEDARRRKELEASVRVTIPIWRDGGAA